MAIALLFAPVACFYFIAPKSRLHERSKQYCLVIPDITDLALYARQRQKLNNWDYQMFYASGYSDAGFRLLTQLATSRIIQQNNLKRSQVITFGQTPWTGFQKIRKGVEFIELTGKEPVPNTNQEIDESLLKLRDSAVGGFTDIKRLSSLRSQAVDEATKNILAADKEYNDRINPILSQQLDRLEQLRWEHN